MKHSRQIKRLGAWYGKLLKIYPATYQQRFSEPMLQTFLDMCHEHDQKGRNINLLALRVFMDTGFNIVNQQIKEVVMQSKQKRIGIGVGLVLFMLLAGMGIYTLTKDSNSQVISPLSTLEEARQKSQGSKEACLPNNEQATKAVRDEDVSLDTTGEYWNFDLEASEGIRDIPAGTEFELTINSFENKLVQGSIVYENNYGSFNYIIEDLDGAGEWEFKSMTACQS